MTVRDGMSVLSLVMILLASMASFLVTVPVVAAPGGDVIWTQTFDPYTEGTDAATAVAVDSSGIYVVGYDSLPGTSQWRIEKRGLTDGWYMTSFGTGGFVVSNPVVGMDFPSSVAVDTSGIYIVGYGVTAGGAFAEWRIEKRGLADGVLLWSQTSNPSDGNDFALGVASDSSGIYVVGYDNVPGGTNYEWRIEKRDLGISASKLAITVYPSSVAAASWTTKYTVQRQDASGIPVTSGSTTVNLASTSTGTSRKFAETAGGTPVTSITIPDGSSTKDFYYYDDAAGTWTISVSASGLTGDSKTLMVNPRSGCIVATAAYGSEMAPEVAYMRYVRDDVIGSSSVGRALVHGWNVFYYLWSPPLAELIGGNDLLRQASKIALLPLAGSMHVTAYTYTSLATINTNLASLVAFLFAAASSITIYAAAPLVSIRYVCLRAVSRRSRSSQRRVCLS